MKKSMMFLVVILVVALSIALTACKPEGDGDDLLLDDLIVTAGIDTPTEGYAYIIESLVKVLNASQTLEIEMTHYENDIIQVDDTDVLFAKAATGVINCPSANTSEKAYYNGKMFFGEDYASFAEISIQEYVTACFIGIDFEIHNLLFSDNVVQVSQGAGYKLTAEANLHFHNYGYEIITDASHKLVSAKLTNTNIWINREVRFAVKTLSSTVPTSELLLGTSDKTYLFQNILEIMAPTYRLTQKTQLKKQVFKSEDRLDYPVTPEEVYNFNGTAFLKTETSGGYMYTLNNKLYTYVPIEDTDDSFLEKTYQSFTEMGYCRALMSWDVLNVLYELEDIEYITKTESGDNITYAADDKYYFILVNGELYEYVVFQEYNEIPYTQHRFNSIPDAITTPGGFSSADFILDTDAAVISQVKWALGECKKKFEEMDPLPLTPDDFKNALWLDFAPHVVTEYPEAYSQRAYYLIVDNDENATELTAIVYGEADYFVRGWLQDGDFEYAEYTGPVSVK